MTTYVRVKDKSTGHEYDLPAGHRFITEQLVDVVKGDRYPQSQNARPAKHHTTKTQAVQTAAEEVSPEAAPAKNTRK